MNWEPRELDEEMLFVFASRLTEFLFGPEPPRSDLPIWGVGLVVLYRQPLPLLLVDESLIPSELPPEGIQSEEVLEQALVPAIEILQALEVSLPPEAEQSAQALGVAPPQPLTASAPTVTSGQAVRCSQTHERGTVGLPVERIDDRGSSVSGFLTAGQCVPRGIGSQVESIHTQGFWSTTYQSLGQVALHSDPNGSGQAGFDAAVVDVDPAGGAIGGPSHQGIARLSAAIDQPLAADVYGSISGTVQGAVVGSLMALGDRNKRLWQDCWMLLPSALTSQGDSGAAVVLDNKEAVGMLVGGSRFSASPSNYLVQYVHDLDSLQKGFLNAGRVRFV
jgi:hypothetical protein